MAYTLNYRWGESTDGRSFEASQIAELLAQLDQTDDREHGDVSIRDNESGIIISVFAGDRGLVVLEDDDNVMHITGVERERALRILSRFVSGDTAGLRRDESWAPGYGS